MGFAGLGPAVALVCAEVYANVFSLCFNRFWCELCCILIVFWYSTEHNFSKNSAYVEVKSVSLVEDSIGKFPDAPTKRGIKHVQELIEFCGKGYRTAVLFVSQRSDTKSITCNDYIDPKFGECLRLAEKKGVELYGINCKVTPTSISLNESVEVVL